MPFDPSQPFEVLDKPTSKPAFDPSKPFEPVTSQAQSKPAFDPAQPFEEATPQHLASDHGYNPAQHAAEDPNAFEDAFAARMARKNRGALEKAGAFAHTLNPFEHPETYTEAAKGTAKFAGGLVATPLHATAQTLATVGAPIARAFGADKAANFLENEQQTQGAESTLGGQHIEEAVKGTASKIRNFAQDYPTAARIASPLLNFVPNKTIGVDGGDEQERQHFREEIEAYKRAQQLGEQRPLETGIIADAAKLATGQDKLADVYSPEAIAAQGARPVSPLYVESSAAAGDPANIALAMAPGFPGGKFIGGGLTELAGKALKAPMALAEAIPGRVGRMARAGAGLEWGHLAIHNPALAAQIAGGLAGAKGLQGIGRILEMQGKELRTGIPSALTDTVAQARMAGTGAKAAATGRALGDTIAHGASTAAGMAPLNFALSDGDPEELAHLTAGAAAFGGTLGAFSASRPMLVEAVRPHLRAQGEASFDLTNETGVKSKAFVDSMPEEARNRVLEIMGVLQGLPTESGKPSQVHVLSAADYLAELQRIGGAQPTGDAGRGFFYGPDGAAYINGQHPQNAGNELMHSIGHEAGGHAAMSILQAAGSKGGPIYEAMMKQARSSLMPNGKPSPEFAQFVDAYNRAFDPTGQTRKLDANNPDSMEEFIAEQAGQLIASEGMANLALPKSILDKVENAVVRGLSSVIGIDSRLVGTRTKFAREEIGAVTNAVRDTLSEIAGMKRGEQPAATPQQPPAPNPAPGARPPTTPNTSPTTQAPGVELNRFKVAAILRRDFGLSQDEAKQWADVANGTDETAAALDAIKQRGNKKFPSETPKQGTTTFVVNPDGTISQPAGSPASEATATATATQAPPAPKGTPEVLSAIAAKYGAKPIEISGQQLTLRGEPAPGVTWHELVKEGHYDLQRGYGDSFTLTPTAKPNEATPATNQPVHQGPATELPQPPPDATPPDAPLPATPDTAVSDGQKLTVVPHAGAFVIHDATGKPVNSRTYVSEKSAQAAIRQMEEGAGGFKLAPNPHPEAPDVIDHILEAGGIDFSKLSKEEAATLVRNQYLRTLLSGNTAPDEIARQLAAGNIGDGDVWTLPQLIEQAYQARKSGTGGDKAAKAEERQKSGEAKATQAKMTEHAHQLTMAADATARAEISEKVAIRPKGLKLNTKEGKAWKAEQGGKEILTPEEADQRVKAAKMKAILDHIGTDDPNGMQLRTDEFGNTEINGTLDPENPYHVELARAGGNSVRNVNRVAEIQPHYGDVRFMLYRKAEKEGLAGEGGEGSVDFGERQRRKEYDAQSAQERAQGLHEGRPEKMAVIPLESVMHQPSGKLQIRAFVLDNLLHNAESTFGFMREKGLPNPYGATQTAQEPLLVADVQAYARNHKNGWKGDGSGPIEQFPDSNLPRPVAGYKPTVIPKDRFDVLNMLFNDERASKTQSITDKNDALRSEGKPIPPARAAQERSANELVALASQNQRFIDPESGETNQLRKQLKDAGFNTGEKLTSIVRTLEPGNVMEFSDKPIEGDYLSVRPTGFSIAPHELGKEGRPNAKAVGASFLPSENTSDSLIESYEKEYRKLPSAYRNKLIGILNRETPEQRKSGLDVLSLKAFPSSPLQQLIQKLKTSERPNFMPSEPKDESTTKPEGAAKAARQEPLGTRQDREAQGESLTTQEKAQARIQGTKGGENLATEAENAGIILRMDDLKGLIAKDPAVEANVRQRIKQRTNRDAQFMPSEQTPKQKAQTRQRDREYAKAVESGDMETAQRHVDEAAQAAGYNVKSHHGTNGEVFTEFDMEMGGEKTAADSASKGIFSTDNPKVAQSYANNMGMGGALSLALGGDTPLVQARTKALATPEGKQLMEQFEAARKGISEASNQVRARLRAELEKQIGGEGGPLEMLMKNGIDKETIYDSLINSKFVQNNEANEAPELVAAYAKEQGAEKALSEFLMPILQESLPNRRVLNLRVKLQNPKVYDAEGKTPAEFALSERIQKAKNEGHDGVIFENVIDPDEPATHYVVFDPSQIKAADPITRDDKGRIIPPSERFNPDSKDIRFMPSTLKEDAQQQTEWLKSQAKEKGYDSITRFLSEHPAEFTKLAAQWRQRNVREDEAGNLRYMPSEQAKQKIAAMNAKTVDELIAKIPNLPPSRENNRMDAPHRGEWNPGTLYKDGYGENQYIYEARDIDPKMFGELLKLEGMKYEDVVNMPTTQKYIEWYQQGEIPPPITAIKRSEGVENEGRYVNTDRRRVVAAIEAGVSTIPAFVEIGRANELFNNHGKANFMPSEQPGTGKEGWKEYDVSVRTQNKIAGLRDHPGFRISAKSKADAIKQARAMSDSDARNEGLTWFKAEEVEPEPSSGKIRGKNQAEMPNTGTYSEGFRGEHIIQDDEGQHEFKSKEEAQKWARDNGKNIPGLLAFMPTEFTPTTPKEKAIARNSERAGSIYQGVGMGLHHFKDLTTNGNFSVKDSDLSPEAIQKKADAVRKSFADAEKPEFMPSEIVAKIEAAESTNRLGERKVTPEALGLPYEDTRYLDTSGESEDVQTTVPASSLKLGREELVKPRLLAAIRKLAGGVKKRGEWNEDEGRKEIVSEIHVLPSKEPGKYVVASDGNHRAAILILTQPDAKIPVTLTRKRAVIP